MFVLAIDPGYSTGMAYVKDGELIEGHLATEYSDILDRVLALPLHYVVVIEDFVGSGPRTKEAITVLKMIGGVSAICYSRDIKCVERVPQQRIPLRNEARERLPKGTIIHVIDAYAHALAYQEGITGYVER